MVRLKNLLRDIHDKPMDEQYNYIKSNFFLWKEDLEQVDDVLFMGVKLYNQISSRSIPLKTITSVVSVLLRL
jgi:hypothetical protein